MKLEDIVDGELSNTLTEVRQNSLKYEEIVFLTENMSAWDKILTEKFGPSLNSEKQTDSAVLDLANANGGIRNGQTLYYGIYESKEILIMIWPWQDNKHVTLKKIIPE
jgi:hypothetical protein